MSDLVRDLVLYNLRPKKTKKSKLPGSKRRKKITGGGGGGGAPRLSSKDEKKKKKRPQKHKAPSYAKFLDRAFDRMLESRILVDGHFYHKSFDPLTMGKYGLQDDEASKLQVKYTNLYNNINYTWAGIINKPLAKGKDMNNIYYQLDFNIAHELREITFAFYVHFEGYPQKIYDMSVEDIQKAWANTPPGIKTALLGAYLTKSNYIVTRPKNSDTGDTNPIAFLPRITIDKDGNRTIKLFTYFFGKEIKIGDGTRIVPTSLDGKLDRFLWYSKLDKVNLDLTTISFLSVPKHQLKDQMINLRAKDKYGERETMQSLVPFNPKPYVGANRKIREEYENLFKMGVKLAKGGKDKMLAAAVKMYGADGQDMHYGLKHIMQKMYKHPDLYLNNIFKKFEKDLIDDPVLKFVHSEREHQGMLNVADRMRKVPQPTTMGYMDEIEEEEFREATSDTWRDYGETFGCSLYTGELGHHDPLFGRWGRERTTYHEIKDLRMFCVMNTRQIRSYARTFDPSVGGRRPERHNPEDDRILHAIEHGILPANGESYGDEDIPARYMPGYEEMLAEYLGQEEKKEEVRFNELLGFLEPEKNEDEDEE